MRHVDTAETGEYEKGWYTVGGRWRRRGGGGENPVESVEKHDREGVVSESKREKVH